MTVEEFGKRSFRHSMELDYFQRGEKISCMLLSVDFENEVFKLVPFESIYWEEESFYTSIKFVQFPKKKMKALINKNVAE